MTREDAGAWTVARRALDHKAATDVLAGAMPELTSPGGGLSFDTRDVADQLAAGLARAGYALVKVDQDEGWPRFLDRKED